MKWLQRKVAPSKAKRGKGEGGEMYRTTLKRQTQYVIDTDCLVNRHVHVAAQLQNFFISSVLLWCPYNNHS